MSSSSASSPERRAAAVIVAGGAGRRMGGESPARKQYLEIAGVPVLLRAVRAFLHHPAISTTVVVLPGEDVDSPPGWLRDLGVVIVAGGAERGDSVWHGLQAVPEDAGTVLIHDGARPFVTAALIDRVLSRAAKEGAVPGVRVVDTIKEVDDEGFVLATPDRSRLWQAQTPQGFPFPGLLQAYARARREGWEVTDDAGVWERDGRSTRLVQGDAENLKITRPFDLQIAEILAHRLRRG